METRRNTFFFFWLMRHYFLVIEGTMTKRDKFINYFSIAIIATFHKRMELVGKKSRGISEYVCNNV